MGRVGIAPSGGVSFLSNMYEGSITDKEIVKRSGLLDLLNPGDLVIADRGFDIQDLLQPRNILLNIPPFLKGRARLTPQEEMITECIARVRIHVERAIERMKKFKVIGRMVPLSLKPVISQIQCSTCDWIFKQLPRTTFEVKATQAFHETYQ